MTFFKAFNEIKKKYSDNDLIIYEIIFYLSKKVKNKLSYIENRNEQIDFSFDDLSAKCNEYFLLNKPLGSIIKKTKFLGLEIDVFDNVLVPRNDTEFVCLKAKEEIIKKYKNEKVNIVDLCSGTGNIGIFLKKEIENSDVTCVDINQVSIENIKHNAKKNNVSIKVIQGDYFESLINNNLKFDVILMNPPYVSIDELDSTMT
ncbi:MAG: methyltransferase, partial [Mycoplasmoidaceae bacterium]|nr:methyltransferase [Mycoplasmoidaceae bacterium]